MEGTTKCLQVYVGQHGAACVTVPVCACNSSSSGIPWCIQQELMSDQCLQAIIAMHSLRVPSTRYQHQADLDAWRTRLTLH